MSEERFDRIEHELTDFRARFDRIDARFDSIDARFGDVDARFDRVDARFGGVDARFDHVETQLEDLRRHMHVIHEDMMASFAASSERNVVTRDEFHAAVAEQDERVNRRLDPLELAVRQHSAEFARRKRTRH